MRPTPRVEGLKFCKMPGAMELMTDNLYVKTNGKIVKSLHKNQISTGWTKKKGVLKKRKSAMVGVFTKKSMTNKIKKFLQGESKKKWDLKKHGYNYSEIHQKVKKLVCFGQFSSNAAG